MTSGCNVSDPLTGASAFPRVGACGDCSPSGTLTFAPGETTKAITSEVKGDKKKEADETFFLNLSAAVNALLEDDQAIGTILNDD